MRNSRFCQLDGCLSISSAKVARRLERKDGAAVRAQIGVQGDAGTLGKRAFQWPIGTNSTRPLSFSP